MKTFEKLSESGWADLRCALADEHICPVWEQTLHPEVLRIPPDANEREPFTGLSVEFCRRLIRPGDFGLEDPLVRSQEYRSQYSRGPIMLMEYEDVEELLSELIQNN